MMHTVKMWGMIFLASLVFISCTEEKKTALASATLTIVPPSKVRIAQICQSYVQGDFESVVTLMHNYKDQTDDFRSQVVNMMKQRAASRKNSELGIDHMEPSQVVMNKNDKAANVYLDIAYTNGQQEEIIIPMIYDQGNWWIK